MKDNFFPGKTDRKSSIRNIQRPASNNNPTEEGTRIREHAKQLRSFRFHSHWANVLPDTFERERLIVHRCLPLSHRYNRLVFD